MTREELAASPTQLKLRKTVLPVIFLLTLIDVALTNYIFTYFPAECFVEYNAATNWWASYFGFDIGLMIIGPILVTFLCMLLWHYWHDWMVRAFAYILIVSRLFVISCNLYVIWEFTSDFDALFK